MFEKYGKFNSYEEINRSAAGLLAEGDTKSLIELAKENGIDVEDAQDYIDGDLSELVNAKIAALARIELESKELKTQEIMQDWVSYLQMQVNENKDIAKAVMKTNKSLEGCIAALLRWSFGHQIQISQEILKAAGVNASRVTLGIPGIGTAKQIIFDYYMEG